MPNLRSCAVSFTGPDGVTYSTDVTAESLYEAAVLGLVALRSATDTAPGPGAIIEIEVRPPAVRHQLPVAQLQRWLAGPFASPREKLTKQRLSELLAGVGFP